MGCGRFWFPVCSGSSSPSICSLFFWRWCCVLELEYPVRRGGISLRASGVVGQLLLGSLLACFSLNWLHGYVECCCFALSLLLCQLTSFFDLRYRGLLAAGGFDCAIEWAFFVVGSGLSGSASFGTALLRVMPLSYIRFFCESFFSAVAVCDVRRFLCS